MIISLVVWLLRIIVGGTFVFSGFAKAVDPWGSMYKIQEYLAAWGFEGMPREALFFTASVLAMIEFTAGAMLLLGCMRRVSVWVIAALMLVMLPLSIYIAVANPVADCGCFGDALVISNQATMWKNIVLTLLIIVLLKWNTWADGSIVPIMQWIPASACVLYCVVLSFIGLTIQPVVDFRPYKVGEPLMAQDDEVEAPELIYEKDGEQRTFPIDDLPGDDWTYVGRAESDRPDKKTFTIYDGDEDVTEEVIREEGDQVILTVSNPRYHNRARSSMANRVNEYCQIVGADMIGVVAISPENLHLWQELANPDFPVYTADDVAIKELVRGDASLIFLRDGVIQWKRDIYSLPGDFPDFDSPDNQLTLVEAVDDGRLVRKITWVFLAVIGASWLLSLPVVVKWRIDRKRRRAKLLAQRQ